MIIILILIVIHLIPILLYLYNIITRSAQVNLNRDKLKVILIFISHVNYHTRKIHLTYSNNISNYLIE